MKELPLELRLELEQLLSNLCSIRAIERFIEIREHAIDLQKRIQAAYEDQS